MDGYIRYNWLWLLSIRRLFWTRPLRHWQRIICTFAYVKGLNPRVLIEKVLIVCLFNNESGMRHIQSSFILEEKKKESTFLLLECVHHKIWKASSPEGMNGWTADPRHLIYLIRSTNYKNIRGNYIIFYMHYTYDLVHLHFFLSIFQKWTTMRWTQPLKLYTCIYVVYIKKPFNFKIEIVFLLSIT